VISNPARWYSLSGKSCSRSTGSPPWPTSRRRDECRREKQLRAVTAWTTPTRIACSSRRTGAQPPPGPLSCCSAPQDAPKSDQQAPRASRREPLPRARRGETAEIAAAALCGRVGRKRAVADRRSELPAKPSRCVAWSNSRPLGRRSEMLTRRGTGGAAVLRPAIRRAVSATPRAQGAPVGSARVRPLELGRLRPVA
jgi:hypothetical protein